MRCIVMLFFVFMLFGQSVYAVESRSAGQIVLVERQAGDVKVVMYMTTW